MFFLSDFLLPQGDNYYTSHSVVTYIYTPFSFTFQIKSLQISHIGALVNTSNTQI